jgi:hypothetical protein
MIKDLKQLEYERVDWFHAAQDTNRWRPAFGITVMNLRVP